MEDITFKVILLLKAYNSDEEGITAMLKRNKISPETFEFDKVIKGEETIEEYYEDQASMMSEAEIFYFKILSDNKENEIKVATLVPSYEIEINQFFGNFKLGDFENKRSESAIATKDSILLSINKKLYSTCILNDKRNIRDKEIEAIHQSSFFKLMRKHIFAKNFFYELELIDISKGTSLYKESDSIDYIYIIKEGTFEISITNKNVYDLKTTISTLKSLNSEFKLKEFDDVIKLKNAPSAMSKEMKIKRSYSLFITNQDVFGLWEFVYKSDMVYNVTAISDKATLYRIAKEKLEKDNEDFTLLQRGIRSEANKKLKNVFERMIMIKNSVMMKIDVEFTKRMKEEEIKFYKQIKGVVGKNNVNSNQVSVNNESLMALKVDNKKKILSFKK